MNPDQKNISHKGKKFRTVNKFGQRKKKKAKNMKGESVLSNVVTEKEIFDGGNNLMPTQNVTPMLTEISQLPHAATERKFQLLKNNIIDQNEEINKNENIEGYRLIDVACMQALISTSLCPLCFQPQLTFLEHIEDRKGMAVKFILFCQNCQVEINSSMSSQKSNKGNSYDVNVRAVYAMRSIGVGFEGLKDFCGHMEMPKPMCQKTYQEHQVKVHLAASEGVEHTLQQSVEVVKQIYLEMEPEQMGKDVIDICVSFDGTWLTRGHSSHLGVGLVIEIMTGLIIDFHVSSNYCHGCTMGPKELDKNFQEWKTNHTKCKKNTDVSSGNMEPEAAKILWSRSVAKNKLRYVTVVSDGDSKTFKQLNDLNLPGYEDVTLQKEECVNHVKKRMGKALLDLLSSNSKLKGKGKLTKELVKKMQLYYGWAIQNNSNDLDKMTNAVWASLLHIMSTDDNPHHSRCPTDENSWCKYNAAIAVGKEPPEIKTTKLPQEVFDELVRIYTRLSKPELLKCCLKGKTQNANESANSLIWKRLPKTTFGSLHTVETAVAVAVLDFNKGRSTMQDVLSQLTTVKTRHSVQYSRFKTNRRLYDAKRRQQEAIQRKRIKLRQDRRRSEDKKVEEEGGPSYMSGGF